MGSLTWVMNEAMAVASSLMVWVMIQELRFTNLVESLKETVEGPTFPWMRDCRRSSRIGSAVSYLWRTFSASFLEEGFSICGSCFKRIHFACFKSLRLYRRSSSGVICDKQLSRCPIASPSLFHSFSELGMYPDEFAELSLKVAEIPSGRICDK